MDEPAASAVVKEVLGAIAPEADLDAVDPGGLLQEELDLDSMNFLDFVQGLFERTGVNVPERDYPKIATIRGCAEYLCQHAG